MFRLRGIYTQLIGESSYAATTAGEGELLEREDKDATTCEVEGR